MRTNLKKLFAVLLTFALLATMFVMPANAGTKTYGEYLTDSVPNGDFEVGVEGMAPYGWEMKSVETNLYVSTTHDYTKNHTFKTVIDGDRKVAQLSKVSGGYVTLHSQPTKVKGGEEYYIQFDYKLADYSIKEGYVTPENNYTSDPFVYNWRGVYVLIREYDADGNLLYSNGNVYDETAAAGTNNQKVSDAALEAYRYARSVYSTDRVGGIGSDYINASKAYQTVSLPVTLCDNTTDVEIILGASTYGSTVLFSMNFDNIEIVQADSSELFNGDFEAVNYLKEGGKAVGVAGPAGWKNVGTNNAGKETNTSYIDNHKAVIAQETDSDGKVNNYAIFSLVDSHMNVASGGTGYCLIKSNKMDLPVLNGNKFTVSFKYKSYAADKSIEYKLATIAPSMRVIFYDANGTFVSAAVKTFTVDDADKDWTEFSITATVPAATSNPAYFTVDFYQGKYNGAAVNAVFCVDDIVIDYELSEADALILNGFVEETVENVGYPRPANDFTGNFVSSFLKDDVYGDIYMVTGTASSKTSARKGAVGAIIAWSNDIIDVTPGTVMRTSFRYKIDGYAEARAHNTANNLSDTFLSPSVRFRYYDAEGNVILATTDGTVLTSKATIAGIAAIKCEDINWTETSGTVTVPEGAVSMQYGYFINGGNAYGSALLEFYYSDVVVKADSDSYWSSEEYAVRSDVNNNDTNLFGRILLAGGNANSDSSINIADLVNMNNSIAGGTYSADADMNKNGKIDEDDIQLLKWKLLGLDTEAKVESGTITEANILKDKTMLFCGDSIMAETAANEYMPWSYQINLLTGADTTNVAKGGSTFVNISGHGHIVSQIKDNVSDYDYLIFEGGTNDTGRSDLGEISDSYDIDDLDQTTIIGSMEAACYYAHTLYPNAKIGYIVTYRFKTAASSHDATFAAAKQVCEKWNIPYIDLYDGTVIVNGEELSYSLDILDIENRESHFAVPEDTGDVHIAASGYVVTAPYVLDWIYTLTDNVSPIPAE